MFIKKVKFITFIFHRFLNSWWPGGFDIHTPPPPWGWWLCNRPCNFLLRLACPLAGCFGWDMHCALHLLCDLLFRSNNSYQRKIFCYKWDTKLKIFMSIYFGIMQLLVFLKEFSCKIIFQSFYWTSIPPESWGRPSAPLCAECECTLYIFSLSTVTLYISLAICDVDGLE